jgi:pilus biogenesis lipoprotein CpaD
MIMTMKRMMLMVALPVLVSGCISEFDMHGKDPKAYYKEHPIKNTVETRYESHMVHFAPGSNRLPADDIDDLRAGLHAISPEAVETVQVQMHPAQMRNEERKKYIGKLLRSMGFAKRAIIFEPSENVDRNDVKLDIGYASVVSPRCPDWRTSSVTTYSNTQQGGFGCANVTNAGLMVADPRDLERGTGGAVTVADPERNWNIIRDYKNNVAASPAGATTGATATPSP